MARVGTREGGQAGRRRKGPKLRCTVTALSGLGKASKPAAGARGSAPSRPSGLGKGAGWPPREGQSAVAPSRPHGTRERWRRHQASERRRMRV
ncbi:hypothetical protein OsJ_24489 [Oryza sativa Japonica Group]|uniref:Uncharacterized protein n=1 Tax=Oryza sativa subsp. japonica TaxID=39947 RepID=A3BKG2_ORYSJ|nr:hypothetical protein OsJ_24489 [Oryza sativa Japonica Group]